MWRPAHAGTPTPCCAVGKCCRKRLPLLTLACIHSVLTSALEHAVREEGIPRNIARNARTGTPRPRRFNPLTADEAQRFLAAQRATAGGETSTVPLAPATLHRPLPASLRDSAA